MRCVVFVLLSALCCGFTHIAAGAEVLIDSSMTINGRYEQQGLRIVAGVVPQTTVHFVDPAYVERTVYLEDDSVLEMSGGEIHDSLYLADSTVANLTGGTIGDTVHNAGFSVVTANGATLLDYIYSEDFSLVSVLDGSVWGTVARGGSLIAIHGGAFQARDQESILVAEDDAKIYVYGSDFNYGLGPIGAPSGTLSGVLANGTPILGTFSIQGNGEIILVPEPATLALLASGLLVLAWTRKSMSARWPGSVVDGKNAAAKHYSVEVTNRCRLFA